VLLAADDFEGLLETLDILSDQACVQRIAAAQRELAEGGGRSLEAIRRELRDGECPG
jgi:PHD/YefM family antitoxin component YafN of YafNO toxin-antitoxin module